MQYKIMKVDASGETSAVEELNQFLRSHRVVSVYKEFQNSSWCFCIEYLLDGKQEKEPSRGNRIDYRDVLANEDFLIYSQLREIRKQLSLENGTPVYTICTNEQMAMMVQNRCRTRSELQKIPGFGASKLNKYADAFLEVLKKSFDE